MTPLDRLALGSRAFCLSVCLLLAGLTGDAVALQYTLVLLILGLAGGWVPRTGAVPHAVVAVGESAAVGLLLGLVAPAHPQLLPYLLAPSLVAGLAGGLFPLLAAAGMQLGGVLVLAALGDGLAAVPTRAEFFAPWLLISFGTGLLGAWTRQIGLGPASPTQDPSYEAARRLVGRLRTVARRLSDGLDPVAIGHQVQTLVVRELGAERAFLLVRTSGGLLTPLLLDGADRDEPPRHDDPLVQRCWHEGRVVTSTLDDGHHRSAVPLRAEARMFGVLLVEHPQGRVGPALVRRIGDLALRLDAALAFSEVRDLATNEERSRLAREIHDGIAQELASLGYLVDDIAATAPDDATEVLAGLTDLRAELSRVVGELRLSIFDLRSEVSTNRGLGIALSDLVQQVGSQTDLTVHLSLDEAPTRLRPEVEAELLRIVQEAVTNARKHAGASSLWVSCRVDPPTATVTVRDDGRGLGSGRNDSFGLDIMRERAARINAHLSVQPAAPSGTIVTVRVGEPAERRRDRVRDVDGAARR